MWTTKGTWRPRDEVGRGEVTLSTRPEATGEIALLPGLREQKQNVKRGGNRIGAADERDRLRSLSA